MNHPWIAPEPPEAVASAWGLEREHKDKLARLNIAPTQEVLAVVRRGAKRVLLSMRWGLIPHWAENPAMGSRLINARAESLTQRAAFQIPFRSQRCLIVADGFYVWRDEGGHKTPLRARVKGERLIGLAALYDTWQSPEGETISSCAIITTPANALVRPIQSRMPAILPGSAHDCWLDPTQTDTRALLALLKPYPAAQMELQPVTTDLRTQPAAT